MINRSKKETHTFVFSLFRRKLRRACKVIKHLGINKKISEITNETLEIYELFFSAISKVIHLRKLNISSTKFPDFGLIRLFQTIKNNESLKILDLSNNNLSSLALKYLFQSLQKNKSLDTLNLFNNELYKENMKEICTMLRKNKRINEINLNFCKISESELTSFLHDLSKNRCLKRIKLSNNDIDEVSMQKLAIFLGKINKLEILDLSYNKITLSDWMHFQEIFQKIIFFKEQIVKINTLNLSGTNIKENSLLIFNFLFRDEKVKISHLNLTKTGMNFDSLKIISSALKNISFSVNLSHNILDSFCNAEFDCLTHLYELNLSASKLSKKGVISIIELLKDNRTKWKLLNLSSNTIENWEFTEIIEALLENNQLETLEVSDNLINDDAFYEIKSLVGKINLKSLILDKNQFFSSDFLGDLLFIGSNLKEISLNHIIARKISHVSIEITKTSNRRSEENCQMIRMLSLKGSSLILPRLLSEICGFNNLKELYLDHDKEIFFNHHISLIFKGFLSQTRFLKTLQMSRMALGNLPDFSMNALLQGFARNKSITELNLSHNYLNKVLDRFLFAVSKISNLNNINISYNLIDNSKNEIMGSFLKNTQNLEELDLSSNLIGFMVIESICNSIVSNKDSNIKILKLAHISFSIDCLIPLSFLLSFHPLTELDISKNDISMVNTVSLSKLKSKNYENIVLKNRKFDQSQFDILLKILSENIVKNLDLSRSVFYINNILPLFSRLSYCRDLIILNISSIEMRDSEISIFLKRLDKDSILQQLHLNNLNIATKASAELSKFITRTNHLKVLDLACNKLNLIKSFFFDLREALKVNASIETLSLKSSHMKDLHLFIFSEIFLFKSNIRKLNLSQNCFSCNAVGSLIEVLKKSKVESLIVEKVSLLGKVSEAGFCFSKLKTALVELYMKHDFNNKKEEIGILCENLKNMRNLRLLDLSENDMDAESSKHISEIILSCSSLEHLNLYNNEFEATGLNIILNTCEKNQSLAYLNISKNIKKNHEFIQAFYIVLTQIIKKSTSLELIDISSNGLKKSVYPNLLKSLQTNNKLFLINDQWSGIKNELAILLLKNLSRFYQNFDPNRKIPKVHQLNFSQARLDDDFCIFFAHHITEFAHLEKFDISENKKITLIGLKYIFVHLYKSPALKKIFFKEYSNNSILNTGIASSIVIWSKSKGSKSFIMKRAKKMSFEVFSRLESKASRFQYCESFEKFSKRFSNFTIFIFFLANFFIHTFLSICLPVYFMPDTCGKGHEWDAHIIFGIYLFITILIEMIFWVAVTFMIENDEISIDKTRILVNDFINLVGGVFLRFDTYTDICFITITYRCESKIIFWASFLIASLKVLIRILMCVKTLGKILYAILRRRKMNCWNLYVKMAAIQEFLLMNDILDRYCPGNAKTIKRFFFKRMKHSMHLSINLFLCLIKFFLEDFPQTILQSVFLIYTNNQNLESFKNQNSLDMNFIVILSVIKNILTLLISFYTTVSIKPSYVEQSDFDEKLLILNLMRQNNSTGYNKISDIKKFGSTIYVDPSKNDLDIVRNEATTKTRSMRLSEYMQESDVFLDISDEPKVDKIR